MRVISSLLLLLFASVFASDLNDLDRQILAKMEKIAFPEHTLLYRNVLDAKKHITESIDHFEYTCSYVKNLGDTGSVNCQLRNARIFQPFLALFIYQHLKLLVDNVIDAHYKLLDRNPKNPKNALDLAFRSIHTLTNNIVSLIIYIIGILDNDIPDRPASGNMLDRFQNGISPLFSTEFLNLLQPSLKSSFVVPLYESLVTLMSFFPDASQSQGLVELTRENHGKLDPLALTTGFTNFMTTIIQITSMSVVQHRDHVNLIGLYSPAFLPRFS